MPDAQADPPTDRYDVIVAGVYFCDLIFTGLPQMPALGQEIFGTGFDLMPGGTFNIVLAMHRLGLKVGWHCDFGSDFVSQYVLDAARAAGIDDRFFTQRDEPLQNLTVSLSFAHNRAFVTYADLFTPPAVGTLLDETEARCVAVPVLYHRPDLLTLSETAHRQGSLVFMDCAQFDVTLDSPGIVETLGAVDIFSANESELLQLTGEDDLFSALETIAPLTPLVVVKLGEKGAIARQGSDEIYVPALPGIEVVDTTGAGDCFNAGFLFGTLRGYPINRCLQIANIVGGLSTQARGTQRTPTLAEVEQHLATYSAQ